MTALLDAPRLDLAVAMEQLRDLRERQRQLGVLTVALLAAALLLLIAGGHSIGVPLLIGAAGALAFAALYRADERRLLVALVAQGDAWALDGVPRLAAQLRSPRERRRLARGLRAAAEAATTGSQLSMMVNPARASDAGERLLSLAEHIADPLVKISAPAAALCRRLLCDAQHSPLYNPHVPERDLGRVLDVLERDLTGRP